MDLSRTIIPKSDQLNFEDVQSQSITAVIKSVRAGNSEQPVFIDLEGYDGRPYKPSKSMRRVLIGGWGADGHSWVGRSLTLIGDASVRFGGVAVGGIKIHAMSDVEADFSMMLSVSRGKRQEHRVRRLEVKQQATPETALKWFSDNALSMDAAKLEVAYKRTKGVIGSNDELLAQLDEIYNLRKADLEKE
ncbi:Phage protein [Enterobacter intestinihominis]